MGEDDFKRYLDAVDADIAAVVADMNALEAAMTALEAAVREYDDYVARRTGAETPTVAELEAQFAQTGGE